MAGVPVEFRTWHLPHTSQKLYAWSSFIDGTHAPSDLRPVPKTLGGVEVGDSTIYRGPNMTYVFL